MYQGGKEGEREGGGEGGEREEGWREGEKERERGERRVRKRWCN